MEGIIKVGQNPSLDTNYIHILGAFTVYLAQQKQYKSFDATYFKLENETARYSMPNLS